MDTLERSTPVSVKPLFGAVGESYFGDKVDFCGKLLNQMSVLKVRELQPHDLDDPVATMSTISKKWIFDRLLDLNLDPSKLIKVKVTPQDADAILEKTSSDAKFALEASNGVLPPTTVLAKAVLQSSSLEKVCQPPAEPSKDYLKKIAKFRKKFAALEKM